MKVYKGRREMPGAEVYVNTGKGPDRQLPLRLELGNHSPTGFEWGYVGSGPHQLALALLGDVFDRWTAQALGVDFLHGVTSRLPQGNWKLTEEEIFAWVQEFLRINPGVQETIFQQMEGEQLGLGLLVDWPEEPIRQKLQP